MNSYLLIDSKAKEHFHPVLCANSNLCDPAKDIHGRPVPRFLTLDGGRAPPVRRH